MNRLNEDRLQRFIADEVMADSVKELLMQAFIKKRQGDVNLKAAQMMALEMLEEAWKELDKFKGQVGGNKTHNRQVGL